MQASPCLRLSQDAVTFNQNQIKQTSFFSDQSIFSIYSAPQNQTVEAALWTAGGL